MINCKAYVIKDKMIADVESINFVEETVDIWYLDIDIKETLSFKDIHFMKPTGKKDLLGNDIYEGHALYQFSINTHINYNNRILGIRNFSANGSCPYKLWDNIYEYYQQDRVGWIYANKSIIIGTIWDDINVLKSKFKSIEKTFKDSSLF